MHIGGEQVKMYSLLRGNLLALCCIVAGECVNVNNLNNKSPFLLVMPTLLLHYFLVHFVSHGTVADQNDKVTRKFTVAVDGADDAQCLNTMSICRTMAYIIENACVSHVHIAIEVKYHHSTLKEPYVKHVNNKSSSYDCHVTVSGENNQDKPHIEFENINGSHGLSDQCNIFQVFLSLSFPDNSTNPVVCGRDMQLQHNTLSFKNLVIAGLVLRFLGQPDFSAENVDFVDFLFSTDAMSKLHCIFYCIFCSFSVSPDKTTSTSSEEGSIQLQYCLCLSVKLQHSSVINTQGLNFVKVLNPGQPENQTFSVITIQNCSMTNNTGSLALFLSESSCSYKFVVHVFVEDTVFLANRVSVSPITINHCQKKLVSQIQNIVVSNCTFLHNFGEDAGVIVLQGAETSLVVTDSQFYGNAGRQAGCIWVEASRSSFHINVTRCGFDRNTGRGAGSIKIGGTDSVVSMTVTDSEFYSNTGGFAGSVYVHVSDSSIAFSAMTSKFHQNTAIMMESGGTVCIAGGGSSVDVSVSSSQFFKNRGQYGGSLFFDGWSNSSVNIIVSNSEFHENAGGHAGSVHIDGRDSHFTIIVTRCKCCNNTGFGWGSGGCIGVRNEASSIVMNVSESEFHGNIGQRMQSSGSVFIEGPGFFLALSVVSCKFNANTGEAAGSIFVRGSYDASLIVSAISCEFYENSGASSGAIYINGECSPNSGVTVRSSRFFRNTGVLLFSAGSIYIKGCLFQLTQLFSLKGFSVSSIHVSIRSNRFVDNTAKGSGSISVEGLDSLVDIDVTSNDFDGNVGQNSGSIYLSWDEFLSFSVTNSSFSKNSAEYGGAIGVESRCVSVHTTSTVNISHSQFAGNIALKGGSAINTLVSCAMAEPSVIICITNTNLSHNLVPEQGFDQTGGTFLLITDTPPSKVIMFIIQCQWENNTSSTYGGALAFNIYESSIVQVVESEFIDNSATGVPSHGGALYLHVEIIENNNQTGEIILDKCRFENNAAADGGSIFQSSQLTFKTELEIENTMFRCCLSKGADFISLMIFSNLRNIEFHYLFESSGMNIPGIFLNAPGPYLLHNVYLSCQRTDIVLFLNSLNVLSWDLSDMSENSSFGVLSSLSAFCIKCTAKPFAAGNGTLHIKSLYNSISNINAKVLLQHYFVQKSPCQPCPFGADCVNGNIKALPNYWGYWDSELMFFASCPAQYCCNNIDVACDAYDTCAPYRTGQLCGECEEGFTESLMSTICIADEMCDDQWLWPLVFALAFSYLIWYMYRGNILLGFQTIFKRHQICASDNESCQQVSHEANNAFFDILVYFGNIISLLKIQVQLQNSDVQSGVANAVDKYFMKYVDVDVQQILHLELCPFPGIDASIKVLARPIFTVTVFLVWCFLFSANLAIFCVVTRSWLCETPQLKKALAQFRHKLLESFVETSKYSYSGFAGATFILLTCVKIKDKFYWKYNAEVECYSTLQICVILFAAFYTLPLVFVSPIAGKLLRRGHVGYVQVMFACVFPFPLLVFWGFRQAVVPILLRKHWLITQQQMDGTNRSGTSIGCSVSTEAQILLDTYQGAYKKEYCFWECVIEIRKLIFSSFYLIHNNIYRLILCSIFNVIFLVHHIVSYPFAHVNSNRAEALSLSLLCVACITNGVKSVISQLGFIVEPNTPTEELLLLVNRLDRTFTILLILFIILVEFYDFLQKLYCSNKKK